MRGLRVVPAVLGALALVMSGCAGDDAETVEAEGKPVDAPALSIAAPVDGAKIAGNVVTLELDLEGIDVVKADGDTSGKTGHFHVFIDKEPVAAGALIEKGPGIIHSTDNPLVVPGLTVGEHTLHVVVGDGTHTRLDVEAASVQVTVDGPTVDATAPATVAAGAPVVIDVAVSGLQLVKADGATGETTGHLHAFVGTAPVAAGEAIAVGNPLIIHSATSPITVTGLAAGEHTIWIVVGDGTHHAFKTPVRDKVVVTVA
ncbi:MAG: DUF4399 domain-containing protein [Acidimicrobiales bacterium]|nr:DUF4399 domain-containing protein [Acidimicrobiales bacterium]